MGRKPVFTLGDRLRKSRELAGITQAALDPVVEAIRAGDVEGRDPLPYPEYRRALP